MARSDTMEKLTIRLPPGQRECLEQLVEDDVFPSMGEAIREGIRHLTHHYDDDAALEFTTSYRNNGHQTANNRYR